MKTLDAATGQGRKGLAKPEIRPCPTLLSGIEGQPGIRHGVLYVALTAIQEDRMKSRKQVKRQVPDHIEGLEGMHMRCALLRWMGLHRGLRDAP